MTVTTRRDAAAHIRAQAALIDGPDNIDATWDAEDDAFDRECRAALIKDEIVSGFQARITELERAVDAARDAALEDAAKAADRERARLTNGGARNACRDIALVIRALKAKRGEDGNT